jgi:hypothetical protein
MGISPIRQGEYSGYYRIARIEKIFKGLRPNWNIGTGTIEKSLMG